MKQKGFTLIEIMISLMLGLIVIGGAISIYISTIKGSSDTVKSARLNYDLEAAMQFMVNDIRRAGYWSGAVTGSDSALNPFTQGGANITISNITGGVGDNCILYSYDGETENGTPDTNEYYGFKLENSTIKSRYLVANTTATELPCNKGSWEDILDSGTIEITSLTFSSANTKCLNTSTSPNQLCSIGISSTDIAVETRQIDITLVGRVKNDTSVTKTLTGIVKVRNNRTYVEP